MCTCKWSRTDLAELREIPRSAEGPPHMRPSFSTLTFSLPFSTTATSGAEARGTAAATRAPWHVLASCFDLKSLTELPPSNSSERDWVSLWRRRLKLPESDDVAIKCAVKCVMLNSTFNLSSTSISLLHYFNLFITSEFMANLIVAFCIHDLFC